MKKLVSLILALLMAAATGCSAKQAVQAGTADTSWNKVKSSGQLVMGLDKSFPPMGFIDTKTGNLTGFDIDLAREACKRLGIKLKLQPIDWDNKLAELNDGNVDCLWNGFSKTAERAKQFNLSFPYMKNNQILLVKSGSSYRGLGSLKGKAVGVQSDSSAETAINGNTAFKNSLGSVVPIDDYSKAVLEIQNGTVDAVAIDEIVARYYLEKNPGAYRILQNSDGKDASLATEDYVVAFRRQDNALKGKVEGALKAMASDGTMAKISARWFGKDITTVGK